MPIAHNLGFPPLGAGRELKRATESYWNGKVARDALLKTGAELRARHWRLQQAAGLDLVPSNDFSYYDRMLDICALVGAVPKRYGWVGGPVDLDTYFAMARGAQQGGRDVTAMEMTKWFDTNYHYIVPEFEPAQAFRLSSSKPVDEFQEAKALGIHTKPVLIGPVTFLLLGKARTARFDRLSLLDALLPVYADALSRLGAAGATWVQLDEPCLALDRTPAERAAFGRAYRFLADRVSKVKLLVATYFAGLDDNVPTALELPVAGLHVDATRAPGQLDAFLKAWPAGGGREGKVLSLGVIDGRNVWKADLNAGLRQLEEALERAGAAQLWVAPSCSLLHVPIDLDLEKRLDAELKGWLAFAKQKLAEVAILTRALRDGRDSVAAELDGNARALAVRRQSRRIHDPAVRQRGRGATCGGRRPTPSGARSSCGCRSSPPRRSAPSRRPPRCGPRGRNCTTGRCRPRTTRRSSRIRSRAPSSSKRSWGSTCWCTGSSSGTTWWSTSASSCRGSRSRSTPGCSRTARATSSRRSSTGTSRGRDR